MSSILITILIAMFTVLFLMISLALTILIKKRPLESEVGENRHMKERGIECTTTTMLKEEARLRGEDPDSIQGCAKGVCGSCETEIKCEK